ncbi:MAG: hypothetical protein GWO03_14950, partial [Gammaproteobacteria bacterium]|nr:hypothetical protein [Gammaproteobacteria bacterium]
DVALVVAGYYIGEDWQRVQRILTTYNRSVLAVLVVVIAFWAWRRWGRPRRMRQSPNESDR